MTDPRDLAMGLLSIISAYFWYDKTRLDTRVDNLEKEVNEQKAKHDVLETKIDGLKELLNTKFDMVLSAIKEK